MQENLKVKKIVINDREYVDLKQMLQIIANMAMEAYELNNLLSVKVYTHVLKHFTDDQNIFDEYPKMSDDGSVVNLFGDGNEVQ